MVKREIYLERLRNNYHTDLIKVIVGLRRSGKSVLLEQIKEELISNENIEESNIIYINFDSLMHDDINNYKDLYNHVKSLIVDNKGKYYILLDEVQNIEHFEKALVSFCVDFKASTFITGVDSEKLSKEVSTNLTGRYIRINLYPLSFIEYKTYVNSISEMQVDDIKLLIDYYKFGGLPQIVKQQDLNDRQTMVTDLIDAILLKDIINRHKINDTVLLKNLVNYLLYNSSNSINISNILAYLKATFNKVTKHETIINYINYLISANLFEKSYRYDITLKKIISRSENIYIKDLGLRNCLLSTRKIDFKPTFLSMVYNHLIVHNYTVYAGKIKTSKVDFMCIKGNQKAYIQVVYPGMPEEQYLEKEKALTLIDDNFNKYIITSDVLKINNYEENKNIIKNIPHYQVSVDNNIESIDIISFLESKSI